MIRNMGLDMYLIGKKYIGFGDKTKVTVTPDILKGYEIKQLEIELIYWRKANQIHNWFVENVQKGEDNCAEYDVSEEQLKSLYDIVCEVINDHSKAPALLPTQSGFFFGSIEYSEYYFKDLEETKEKLETLFKSDILKTVSVYYNSSW